jgi:AcrR family transcriptional regulator
MATTRLTSQARREAILDAAVKLFSDKGFRGVTTRELAAAVGVTEPVLYQHFETKRELYRALIEERASVDIDREIPAFFVRELEHSRDDREFLIRLANGIIRWHVEAPAYIRLLMFSGLEHHELSDLFYERYAQGFFRELSTYFQRRAADGAFRNIDPMLAAQTFSALAGNYGMGLAIFKRSPADLPQQQVVEGFVDIFLEGIKNHS